MPAFKYEALDADGRTHKGLIDAEQLKAARAALRGRGLVPVQVEQVNVEAASSGWSGLLTRRVFNSVSLTVWTRQLASLVVAGLPLERALTALADECEDERQRELVAQLRAEVNGGATFAHALSTAPREFDEVYRAVVAAGEQSGALGLVLERLADDLEEQQALRGQVIGAMVYPAVVTFASILIVIFLLTSVVPKVATVFADSKRALPTLTVVMLALSDFIVHWGWALLLGLIGGAVAAHRALQIEATRLRFDAAMLTLPLLGRLTRGYNAARFAGTLAMLAGAGVPILKALQAAAETLGNRAMRQDALEALVQVREGAPLGSALAGKKRFPGLIAMFARLGEQTGRLPDMLQRAARQTSAEVRRRALAAAKLLEPVLILAMGVMVMLIVLSVLQPIMQMSSRLH